MSLTGTVRPPAGRRTAGLAVIGLTGIMIAACSGGGRPATVPVSVPATFPGTAPSTTPAGPAAVAPLTGRTPVTRRPVVVVKIENSPEARPQSGLGAADIVVEELVEGGVTRFAALFQSADPGTVGPVRSIRNVDAAIAGPTHGILTFSGGAAPALAAVSRTGLRLVQESDRSGAYSRVRSRRPPHNLYLRVATLWARSGTEVPDPYLPFSTGGAGPAVGSPGSVTGGGPSSGGGPAVTSAALTFSAAERPSWTFDTRTRRWLRSESGGRRAVDARGARLVADNVLILRVRIGDAGYLDPIGDPVPETLLTGSGAAALLTDGRQLTGTWSKAGTGARLQLKGEDGRRLAVPPGRTWIELVPVQGTVRVR